jgi:predicted ArsR family transcriptional regulator
MSQWTLFSNHGHVLLYLAREPDARLRDVAEQVGITERAVQKIVRDLQDGGAVSVSKKGRRNRYRINKRKPLRHDLESHRSIGDLVRLLKQEAHADAAPVLPRAAPQSALAPVAAPAKPPVAPESRPAPAGKPPSKADSEADKPARKKKPRKRIRPADEQQGSLF